MAGSDLAEVFGNMVLGPVGPRRQRGRSYAPEPPRRMNENAGHTPVRRVPSVRRRPADPHPLQRDPSIHRRPVDQHPLRRDPSVHRHAADQPPPQRDPAIPRALNPQSAVFFDEGSGYLFVKTLGNGVDGSASLVRSVVNGKLYVRKEEFHWYEVPRHDPKFAVTPPEETANASLVKSIPSTYRAHGWTRWVAPAGMSFDITYWEHCDLGSLQSFVEASRKMKIPVPEVWGAIWFVHMIDVTINVQRAGLVHNDPHRGNWLLQSTTEGLPRIILGDFGRSERKTEMSKYKFKDHARDDFNLILSTIAWTLGLIHDRKERAVLRPDGNHVSPQLVAKLNAFAITSSRTYDQLGELHQAMLDASDDIFRMYRNPVGLTHPAAVPAQTTSLFMTGEGLMEAVRVKPQGFKQWRHANVLGSEITTRSTRHVERLLQDLGEWFGEMNGRRPVWCVDRVGR